MHKFTTLLIAFALLAGLTGAVQAATIPTISIVSVESGKSVTIETANYPANDKFDVLMGKIGTQGKNGIKVAVFESGSGGALRATFNIPSELKDEKLIAIRLQSPSSGFFSYNWFTNKTSGSTSSTAVPTSTPVPGTTPVVYTYPTFSISAVSRDSTVTIKTANFPKDDKFNVYMNHFGTMGKGGWKVAEFETGEGGSMTATFNIPSELKGDGQIAIRLDGSKYGYYAYNWFWNNSTN